MVNKEQRATVAVADSSFLIAVCWLGLVDVLAEIFSEIYIPEAVWREVVEEGGEREETVPLRCSNAVQRSSVAETERLRLLKFFLDEGEAEVISLALERNVSIVLIDEIKARKVAQQMGLYTIGTLGFLLLAKELRYIEQVRPLLDTLLAKGFRVSKELQEAVLRTAGEQ